jgi:hypothetical protein
MRDRSADRFHASKIAKSPERPILDEKRTVGMAAETPRPEPEEKDPLQELDSNPTHPATVEQEITTEHKVETGHSDADRESGGEGGDKKRRTKFDDGNDYMSMSFVTEKDRKTVKRRKAPASAPAPQGMGIYPVGYPLMANQYGMVPGVYHDPRFYPVQPPGEQAARPPSPILVPPPPPLVSPPPPPPPVLPLAPPPPPTINTVAPASPPPILSETLPPPPPLAHPPPPPREAAPPPPPQEAPPPPPPPVKASPPPPPQEAPHPSTSAVPPPLRQGAPIEASPSLGFVILPEAGSSVEAPEKSRAELEKERRRMQRQQQEAEKSASDLAPISSIVPEPSPPCTAPEVEPPLPEVLQSSAQQPLDPPPPPTLVPSPTPVSLDAEAQSKAYMEYQQQYYQWYAQQQQQQQQQYIQQYYQQLSVTNPRVGDPALRRFYGLSDN